MENRIINGNAVEMSVVCSDLSLLENINALLRENGVISVEDDRGILHYIVDGRYNKSSAAGKVTSISSSKEDQYKDDSFLEMCVKSVLREYGFDMSLIGTVIMYKSIFESYARRIPLPYTMKALYVETGRSMGLSYEQSARDVRYAIAKSNLKNMRSREAITCMCTRIERRIGLRETM